VAAPISGGKRNYTKEKPDIYLFTLP